MTQKSKFIIQDLAKLLRDKSPKGVFILEGNTGRLLEGNTGRIRRPGNYPEEVEPNKESGRITKTWGEALDYIKITCHYLNVPYIPLHRSHIVSYDDYLRTSVKIPIGDWIREKTDLALYVAGCLCCTDSNEWFEHDLFMLKNLFRGLERIFVAASLSGSGAPSLEYHTTMPKDGYFLV